MLVPGPAMLFMFGLAMNEGLNKALTALPGLMLGLALSITISRLGAGAVPLASAKLFVALKFLGAAYLFYLAVQPRLYKPCQNERLLKVRQTGH